MLVGVRGFEPPASTSRTWRASQAALHPDGAGNEPIGTRQFPLTAQPAFGDHCPPGLVYSDLKRNNGGKYETTHGAKVRSRSSVSQPLGWVWKLNEHKY